MSQLKQEVKEAFKESKAFGDLKTYRELVKCTIAKEKEIGQEIDEVLKQLPVNVTTNEDEHDLNHTLEQKVKVAEENKLLKQRIDSLTAQLEQKVKVEEENKQKLDKLTAQLTKGEDEKFALTNDFTTADEGSIIKLRDTYRHMQHNLRAAAMREHKKLYDDIPLSLADHCMLAYNNAKASLFGEVKKLTEKSLYQLKISENSSGDNKLSQNYLLLIKSLHDDDKLTENIKLEIEEMLTKEYKVLTNQAPQGIPESIKVYYSVLTKLSWDCVARPIPMIMSTDNTKFDKVLHETKEANDDDDDDNEGRDISYIYPVLLTSNNWPREVALKGKVVILPPTN